MEHIRIRTEKRNSRVNGTVVLQYKSISFCDDDPNYLHLWFNDKREMADTLIKFAMNPIFENITNIEAECYYGVWQMQILFNKKVAINAGILEAQNDYN